MTDLHLLNGTPLRDKAQASGGVPVVSQTSVEADLERAQERYAQAGISLSWGSISIEDPPTGVDLSDGLLVTSGYSWSWKEVAPEAEALIHSLGTDSTNTDIHVFYVNAIDAFGSTSGAGVAIADYWFDSTENNLLYNCFVSSIHRGPFTLPHELAHLLADEDHDPSSYNLLRNGTSSLNLMGGSKRLNASQSQKIQNNSHAQ